MAKEKTSTRRPTLQISCTEEFKRDVDQLAMAFGYADTKTMLFELVENFLNQPPNQTQLKKYRALLGSKPACPFGVTEGEPSKAKSEDCEGEAVAQVAADGGGGSNET